MTACVNLCGSEQRPHLDDLAYREACPVEDRDGRASTALPGVRESGDLRSRRVPTLWTEGLPHANERLTQHGSGAQAGNGLVEDLFR
jgi:hypothetical protein